MIRFSKFFLKSFFVPRKLGFAKFRREKYSERSFYCKDVRLIHENTVASCLDWGTSKNHSALDIKCVERLESQGFWAYENTEEAHLNV